MKRLHEILKPFLAIILGALLLLRYLNFLQAQGATLAIGIVAMVLAAFYLGVGVVGFTLNNKLPESAKKVFEVGAVVAFPLFMFVYFLLVTIRLAVNNLGPNGWFLAILKMIACIAFASVYCVAAFVKNRHLNKFSLLLAAVFVLKPFCQGSKHLWHHAAMFANRNEHALEMAENLVFRHGTGEIVPRVNRCI